jgi:general secretion pathway protein D
MGTPQEYLSLTKLLKQLDVPPRQILLEAKIYEVDLSGAWSSGVTAYLQTLAAGTSRQALASLVGAATTVTAGMLVGKSRELLGTLQLQENSTRAKVISAPSLIATDGIPASINVGNAVPTLSAVVPSGSSTNGTSDNVESVSTQNTGVTLNVLAQINPSGVVTLIVNQEVSAPEPPATGGIQSPSFSKRTVQTQITMQNGDTIAIGGIITEDKAESVSGIPILDKIPVIGPIIFGSKSVTTDRTELIVFITPHVIFDNTDLIDASEELKTQLKKLLRIVRFQ